MKTVMITGANRGIGLELTQQYLNDNYHVMACCRDPANAEDLTNLKATHPNQLNIYALDVTNDQQIQALANELKGQPIDLLISNAGIYGPGHVQLGEFDTTAWSEVFRTNAIAPAKIVETFLPHIANGQQKTIVMISSTMGSIGLNQDGGSYIYRSSKAALNCIARTLAVDLYSQKIMVVAIHPGWVKTAMGGPQAALTAQESVTGIRNVIAHLTPKQSGSFLAYDGEVLPW